MVEFWVFIWGLAWGVATAVIAADKNRNWIGWFILGFFFSFISFAVVAVLSRKPRRITVVDTESRSSAERSAMNTALAALSFIVGALFLIGFFIVRAR